LEIKVRWKINGIYDLKWTGGARRCKHASRENLVGSAEILMLFYACEQGPDEKQSLISSVTGTGRQENDCCSTNYRMA
jgi:hypothetical protein